MRPQSVYHVQREMATLSRPFWGNCGNKWENGSLTRLLLWGTHGSIGGVPPGRPPDRPRPPDELIWEAGSTIPTRVTVAQGQKAADDAWNFVVNMGLQSAIRLMDGEPQVPGIYPGRPRGYPGTGPGRPGHGGGGGGNYGPGHGGGGGGNYGPARTHVVARGESLSLIAGKYYKDVLLWPVIYDANKQKIGPNPNLIQPDWKLKIPSIAGYSPQQLAAIRQRGRNC